MQEQAVQAALRAKTGILQAPTGTGKGRIIGEIIRQLQLPALVLVDKKDLLVQLGWEIQQVIEQPVGVVGNGAWKPRTCTIATVQTLAARLNIDPSSALTLTKQDQAQRFLEGFGVVIVDKAHYAEAETYSEVLQHMTRAAYRFGLSATAFRSYKGKQDNLGTYLKVQAFLGPPIYNATVEEAVDSGRIVAPEIYVVHACVYPGVALNYREEYDIGIVHNSGRNVMIAGLAKRMPGQTVVLVERVQHCQLPCAPGMVDGSGCEQEPREAQVRADKAAAVLTAHAKALPDRTGVAKAGSVSAEGQPDPASPPGARRNPAPRSSPFTQKANSTVSASASRRGPARARGAAVPWGGPPVLRPSEAVALVRSPDLRRRRGARDAALLAVLVGGGLRVGEAVSLSRDNLERAGRDGLRLTFPTSKTRKPRLRTVTLPEWAARPVLRWLQARPPRPWLFPGRGGQHLSVRAAQKIAGRYLGALGRGELRTHSLRHSFGAMVTRQTGSLFAAQKLLGHADPRTTSLYYAAFEVSDADRAADALSRAARSERSG